MIETPVSEDLPRDEENPWQTRAVRQVYQNPWICVEECDVLRPDGKPGVYGLVHPRSVATGIVAMENDGSVWLVGQFRYALSRYSWEIPEGGADPKKDIREEAARELIEETGLSAEHWEHLLTLHTSNCFTSERAEIFVATGLTHGPSNPDPEEQLAVRRVHLSTALAAIDSGEITDAMTVSALLALARRTSVQTV